MESKKAKQYCQVHNLHKNFDDTYFGETIIIVDMAEKEMKEKAIEAFGKVIDDCHNCKDACLPKCGKDCLTNKFKELLNK